MWSLIVTAALTLFVLGLLLIITHFQNLEIMQQVTKGKRIVSALLSTLVIMLLVVLLCYVFDFVNAIICLIHLTVIWLLFDLGVYVFTKKTGKKVSNNLKALMAIGCTLFYLGIGWYLAHHVVATTYAIETEKKVESLRVVQISDAHVGTTFTMEEFEKYMQDIQGENPDLVVITGDFIDDDAGPEELQASCRALGTLHPTYGVFFANGNHDRGYFDAEERGWNAADLEKALAENKVTVLKDEVVEIGENYYLIGRDDLSHYGRLTIAELMKDLSSSRYTIVLDHQPRDYFAEAQAGADLVLSGHTHGGQLLPINWVGEWTGTNLLTYGHRKYDQTDCIVSSGLGCWAIQFKTGCKSEYVVIDIVSHLIQ